MNAEHATPEVIDALARIEIERRKRKRVRYPRVMQLGVGKLYELLPVGGNRRERMRARTPGEHRGCNPGDRTLRNVARTTAQRAAPKGERPWHQQKSWRDAQKKFSERDPERR